MPAPYGVPNSVSVATGLPMALLMAAAAYRLCGLYEVHRLRELPRELSVVCQASGPLFLLDITATFYRRDPYDSRLGMAGFSHSTPWRSRPAPAVVAGAQNVAAAD